jgi:hypothetical protein
MWNRSLSRLWERYPHKNSHVQIAYRTMVPGLSVSLPYFSSRPWEWLLQYDTVMEGLALRLLHLSRAVAQYRQLNDALRSVSELRTAIAKAAAMARSSLQTTHLHTSAALQHDILHRADPHRRELINAYDYFILAGLTTPLTSIIAWCWTKTRRRKILELRRTLNLIYNGIITEREA